MTNLTGACLLQVGDQLVQALLLYCQNFQFESTLYVGGPLALIGKMFVSGGHLWSCLPGLRHASCVMRRAACVVRLASCVLRLASAQF